MWSTAIIKIDSTNNLSITYNYEDIDRKCAGEYNAEWEYLTLGLTDNLWILDDKDQKKLLKQPPGNPFKGLD